MINTVSLKNSELQKMNQDSQFQKVDKVGGIFQLI